MKALHQFIVSFDNRYNDKVDVGDKKLILNTEISERDAEYVNRIAKVVACPTAYATPIEKGDEIIVHHNVARRWYDQRGKEKNTSSFIDDDHFMVYWDQVYGYRKKQGDWISYPGFVFCKPLYEATRWETMREIPLKAVVGMANHHGLEIGAVVGFTPDSEYEFRFDNDIWYRIYAHDIAILYHGLKEGEKTHHSFIAESA